MRLSSTVCVVSCTRSLRSYLHVSGEDLAIELVSLLLYGAQYRLGLLAAPHQDDAFNRVIILLETELSQARRVSDLNLANVANADRRSFVGSHNNALNVLRIAQQSDTAHVIELAALRIKTAAGIRIIVGKGLNDLRYRQVIPV